MPSGERVPRAGSSATRRSGFSLTPFSIRSNTIQRKEGDLTEDELEELKRIANQSSQFSPYFDNVRDYQDFSEVEQVEDWAKEMRKRGHSICKIDLNVDDKGRKNDPPDVLVNMDGSLVGVEVTNLVVHLSDDQIERRIWVPSNSHLNEEERRKHAEEAIQNLNKLSVPVGPVGVEWSLSKFQVALTKSVDKKDTQAGNKREERVQQNGEQALDCRMDKQFLLIFTPELYLQDKLAEYVEGTELPRPKNFDRIFVMGCGVPQSEGDPGIRRKYDPETCSYTYLEVGPNLAEECNPVFEVRLSEETIP